MFPQEIHSPLVAHIGLVNNTVLLAAAQLWQSTKSRSAKMDFIVEIPLCRPESDSFTSIRGRQLSEMCTRRKKQFALRWEPCGVSSARLTPLCASEKNKLAPSRTLEKRLASPYNEARAQYPKPEAAHEQQLKLKLLRHFFTEVARLSFFFTIAGMPPFLPRSPENSQPPYSRVERPTTAA